MVLPTKVTVSKPVSNEKLFNDIVCPLIFLLLFLVVLSILFGYMYMLQNRQCNNQNSCESIDDKTRMRFAAQTTDALHNYPNGTYGRMIWSKFGGEGCIDYFIANGVRMPFIREASDCSNTINQSWRLDSDGLLVHLVDYTAKKSGQNCSYVGIPGTDLCIYPQPTSFSPAISECQPDLIYNRVYFTFKSIIKPHYCLGLTRGTFTVDPTYGKKPQVFYWVSIVKCTDADNQRFYLKDVIYDYEGH